MTVDRPPRYATGIVKRLGSPLIEHAIVAGHDTLHHPAVVFGAIVAGLFVAAMPVWMLTAAPASSLSNVPLPIWVQTLAAWLVVFAAALLSGWLVSRLFPTHRAAAVLSLALSIVVVGAVLLPKAADLGPLALGTVLLLEALAAVGGGSLSGGGKRTARG